MAKKGYAQGCCSGGSGSPIAGGISQGVLQDRQMEVGLSYQYISTSKFFVKDRDTLPLVDQFQSNYLYFRLAYGITKKITMSVESGYFINKSQVGLNRVDTITSGGIGDLILFPRYSIYSKNTETTRNEITIGLGYKIPLGKHDDSTVFYTDPVSGKEYFTTSPPMVQPTTGAQDIIFYTFLYRGYPEKDLRFFISSLYIKTGWNSLGQKFGNYASVSLFAGKTFYKRIGVTLQVKGEYITKMKAAENIDLIALYNIYPESTGGKKLIVSPQLSYTHRTFTVYALSDFPVYQYLNGNQIGSQHQFTLGMSYRFNAYRAGK
ncbi:MAG: hypothetical protein L6Q66_13255 [Bacteroidia bacterium]|nr:hypothetical protein [Bacteroidia bacterium]